MAQIDLARRQLIERRDLHLRALAGRLRDERVNAVLRAVLLDTPPGHIPEDDMRYAIDLGLVRSGPNRRLEVSNPLYREVLLDALTFTPLASIPRQNDPVWMTAGRLDPDKLLKVFADFWRQHGSALMATTDFPELAPHIVVLAFLQRVANGGGWVNREHPAENGRMDVYVELGDVKLAVELKVWRDKQADPANDGMEQLERYMRHIDTAHGWLIVFDRRAGQEKRVDRMTVEAATSPRGLTVALLRAILRSI
mgnify:CR=1 FL=1